MDQDRSDKRDAQDLGDGPPQPDIGARIRKANVKAALFKKPAPMRIGRFILLERIGAGAMGEVYAAYDEQLDRKVALKLVRSAVRDSTRAHERLLREAQTLAQLSHPNVVQVYETGTHEGSVFIAMEFIRGRTLTAWLDSVRELPRKQRQREILRQFVAAGRGLEAAHGAGLAHRDFKPDNVLVGDDDRVRVVDFGLARAVNDSTPDSTSDSSGSERTQSSDGAVVVTSEITLDVEPAAPGAPLEKLKPFDVTEEFTPVPREPGAPPLRSQTAPLGASGQRKAALRLTATGTVMGTPRYMAPEQMRGQTPDHRSDQFSFCVSLFHALYDQWPFEGATAIDLMRAAARGEVVVPRHQAEVPAPVRKALLRGLSADPADRFPSMGELLRIVEAWSQRRRRSIWTLAATAIAAGSVATFASVAGRPEPCAGVTHEIDALWSPARKSALAAAFHGSGIPFAGAAWRGTETLLDDYVTTWRGEAREACEATHVHQSQSAQLLDRRMLCLDRGKQRLGALLASIGGGKAPLSQEVVERAFEAATALPDLAVCSDTRALLLAVEPPEPALTGAVTEVRERLAEARTHTLFARNDDALQVAEVQRRTAEALPYPPVRAEALYHVGLALAARGTSDDTAQAEAMYLDALDIAEGVHHDELAAEVWHQLVLLAGYSHSRMERGHLWSRREQAAVQRIGAPARARAQALHARGMLYAKDGDHAAAAEHQHQAIAILEAELPQSTLLASYYHDLANSERLRGDYGAARTLYERALGLAIEQHGASYPKVARFQRDFAQMLLDTEELDRARTLLEAALATWKQTQNPGHLQVGRILFTLSELEANAGNFERARAHAQAALPIYERTLAPDHRYRAEPFMHLGLIELRQRNYGAAHDAFADAFAIRRRHLGNEHLFTRWTRYYLAESLVGLERHDAALEHCDATLHVAPNVAADGAPLPADLRAMLLGVRGRALLGRGEIEAAIGVLEQAVPLLREHQGFSRERAAAMWALARALRAGGKDEPRARALAGEAHEIYAAHGQASVPERDAIAAWLDEHPAR